MSRKLIFRQHFADFEEILTQQSYRYLVFNESN